MVGFSPACGDRRRRAAGAAVPRPGVHEDRRASGTTRSPTGAAAIRRLGRNHGFAVDTTADPRRFSSRSLARYDVVVFLSTTGTPIKRAGQRRALERFIRGGGGFVGVHAASDTRGDWPWYERLVGARFKRHDPGIVSRTVEVIDRTQRRHPAPARALDAHGRVVRVPLEPDRARSRPRAPRRSASAGVVSPLRWRPLGVHRDGSYEGVLRRAALRRPPARSDRDGCRPRGGSTVLRDPRLARACVIADAGVRRAAAAARSPSGDPAPPAAPDETATVAPTRRRRSPRRRPRRRRRLQPRDQLGHGRSGRRHDHDRLRPRALPPRAGREGGRAAHRAS